MEALTRNDICPAGRSYIKHFHTGAESARLFLHLYAIQVVVPMVGVGSKEVLLRYHSVSSFRARRFRIGSDFLLCLLDGILARGTQEKSV